MQSVIDTITEWIKQFLIECILGNLESMYTDVNKKVGSIAGQVSQTPQDWNPSIFSMVKNVSETVLLPIAGIIITFVVSYELISMLIDHNNMHNLDTWMLFKWMFKTGIAVVLVTHSFDIVMGIFSLAQYVVQASAGAIGGSASIDIMASLGDVQATLEGMENGELFLLFVESLLIKFVMNAIAICILIVLFGRITEIYLYCSVAPVPLATMSNREWGGIGQNYLKGLVALGFQGFFIMICVAIYAALVNSIGTAENIHAALWSCAGYTVLLCFSLFKTGGLSKSIFNAAH